MALPTARFWTAGLQNYEGIHFWCFKPPSLWQFVTASLRTEYGNQMSLATLVFTAGLPKSFMLIGIVSQTQALEKYSPEHTLC